MKVLIAEDDQASLKYFCAFAQAEGHQVWAAQNGKEALALYEQTVPDFILSDIEMPAMTGLELLEALHKRDSEAIVVMVTAYGSEEHAMQALRLGASNYLRKPVLAEELAHLLRQYATIVKGRETAHEVSMDLVRKSLAMRIGNRMHLIPAVVNRLVLETGDFLDKATGLAVRLGLFELVTNAIEHGNLGITYDEKSQAANEDRFADLYWERLEDPALAARKVTIDFQADLDQCCWVISDEGAGFDWRLVPNPMDDPDSLALHGRGIFLSRLQFDELEYVSPGNAVRAMKKRPRRV